MGIIRTAPQSANVLPPRPHRNVAGQRQKQYNGLKIIPGYVEREYFVEVCVTRSGKEILRESLPHFYSPRDFIGMKLGEEYKDAVMVSAPVGIDYKKD